MTDKTQPIEALLEEYVFMVATRYIDQVDTESQTRLISLLVDIGREPQQEDLIMQGPVLAYNENQNSQFLQ